MHLLQHFTKQRAISTSCRESAAGNFSAALAVASPRCRRGPRCAQVIELKQASNCALSLLHARIARAIDRRSCARSGRALSRNLDRKKSQPRTVERKSRTLKTASRRSGNRERPSRQFSRRNLRDYASLRRAWTNLRRSGRSKRNGVSRANEICLCHRISRITDAKTVKS